jgi:regulator of replication initiation timing
LAKPVLGIAWPACYRMPEPEPATVVEEGDESNQIKSAIEENELLRLQLQAMQTALRKAEQERDAAKTDAETARKEAAAAGAEAEASRVMADQAREEADAALAWMMDTTTDEETDEEIETKPAVPSLPIPSRADGGCILCRLSVPWDSCMEPIE